ncbi:homeobox protein 2-like [Culicoides brevitarsis]|uniref:homeobox protein 2-like n=1 Tax=Culicoides brevitarsis TaxID=469753 RepID=UPI00307B7624
MSSIPASTIHRSTSSSRANNIATAKGNVQVHPSYSNNQNGPERVQQLNREIPEENLLTLGTLRYGIRMSSSPRVTERRSMSFPSSTGTNSTSSTNLSRIPSSVSSNQTTSVATTQNGGKDKDCCCIGSSSLPWMHHSHEHHQHQHFGANGVNGQIMSRSTKLPLPASHNNNVSTGAPTAAKNRIVSQSNFAPQYLNHPPSSSLLTSSHREASPPTTVCCYNAGSLSSSIRGNNLNNNNNNSCNKNQNTKSNLIRYVSRAQNNAKSKIRVKSDPCLGGLSVNLVQINDNDGTPDDDDKDGKNHHKLLLLKSSSSSSQTQSSSYVIGKNRNAATVLCKPTTTTSSSDYSNNFSVNNKAKVNYSGAPRTSENLNLLNCFANASYNNNRRDSRSSSVCLEPTEDDDEAADVSLRKSDSRKSLIARNDSQRSESRIAYRGHLNKSFKKPSSYEEQIPNLAENLNFIDCSSSGDVSLRSDDDSSNNSQKQKRSFLHTIPTVSPLLTTLTENTQNNIDFNKNQNNNQNLKLKEFYEQKTLNTAADLHKFKSNSNNINQRYKTIAASEYANNWNPNENYPNNNNNFYETTKNLVNSEKSNNKVINNKNFNGDTKISQTVPRNINTNKNLKYYQSQQINGSSEKLQNNQIYSNCQALTKSQQDIQKQRAGSVRRS